MQKNKKIIIGILFLVFVGMFSLIYAQETAFQDNEIIQTNKQKAGITPDSFLWNFDRAGEKIQLSLTFNVDKETELRFKIADERLAEIQLMIQKNNSKAAEKAEKVREQEINELEKLSARLSNETKTEIQENLEKHILVLREVMEKAPEQAQKGLENAINQSSKALEKFQETNLQTNESTPQNISGGAAISAPSNTPRESAQGGEAISVPMPPRINHSEEWFLEKGKNLIISYVGEDYYNEHIFLKELINGKPYNMLHSISYTYGFKVKNDINESSMNFILFVDRDGNLYSPGYTGPTKPYAFNISRAEAKEIAKEAGMNYLGEPEITSSYIWSVSTAKYEYKKLKRVYIDVDSGKVLGVENETTLILTEEQKAIIEEIIRKEYPDILSRTYFWEAEEVPGEPNQTKVLYGNAVEGYALIIIDLKNETIVWIEKNFD